MKNHFILGRLPIFDEKLDVLGYRLALGSLDHSTNPARIGADRVTFTDTIALDMGAYFGDRPVLIPAHPAMLIGGQEFPLPPGQAVIEITPEAADRPGVLDACREMVRGGYEVAIDAGLDHELSEPLLELATYIELEVGVPSREKVGAAIRHAGSRGAKVVVKGADTLQQQEMYKELGFEWFESYMLSKPVTRINEALTPSRLTCLQLIEVVNHPDTTPRDIEAIVEREPGLSYRLLHISGVGSAGGLRRPVDSISEAVVLLGRDRMYNWLILMLISDANRGTPEQMAIAMTRARMCKLLASATDRSLMNSAYTVGLVSALDLLLGTSLAQIVENLAITDQLRSALLHHEGLLGSILADSLAWEGARIDPVLACGVDLETAESIYLDSLAWAVELCTPFENLTGATS